MGDIQTLVNRWTTEAVALGRTEVFDELLHEDVHDMTGGLDTRGRESFKTRAVAVRDAFEDRSVRVDSLIIEGDHIAWRWTFEGRHAGPFAGLAPTGKRVVLRGANFQRIAGGVVIEHWSVADIAGALRQLA